MTTLDRFLQHNKEFAAQQSAAGTLVSSLPRAMPNVKALIIGCADMRVDPAHVLGINPGEAVVLRNIGGRLSPSLLDQMGLLHRIGQVSGQVPGGGGEFHIIVMQHTDCGMTRLAGIPPCWPIIFKYRKGNSTQKQPAILAQQSPPTLPLSARSPHCPPRG
jgi:carbonic anhydrase